MAWGRTNHHARRFAPLTFSSDNPLQAAVDELIAILGQPAFYQWACSLPTSVIASTPAYLQAIQAEIERLRPRSFEAIYGRPAVAGEDYDPQGPMSQDEHDFYAGAGIYAGH